MAAPVRTGKFATQEAKGAGPLVFIVSELQASPRVPLSYV